MSQKRGNVSKKQNDVKLPESLIEIKLKQQQDAERDPSPGFQLVVIGLVGYMIHASGLFTIKGLLPISIGFVVIGFVALIIETLGKVKFR